MAVNVLIQNAPEDTMISLPNTIQTHNAKRYEEIRKRNVLKER